MKPVLRFTMLAHVTCIALLTLAQVIIAAVIPEVGLIEKLITLIFMATCYHAWFSQFDPRRKTQD